MSESLPLQWDLSCLFTGLDDPRIEETLQNQKAAAQAFAAKYRGRINARDLSASRLRKAMERFQAIIQEASKPVSFASLLFAADTGNVEYGAFLQKMRERSTEIQLELLFFDLELLAVPNKRMKAILADPEIAGFAHYITALRLSRKYALSEPEEKILQEKANTAERAFARLFDETVAGITFTMKVDGKTQKLTEPEVLHKQRDANREVREASAKAITAGLKANAHALTFVTNTLLQDKATEDRLRGYDDPAQSRHIANELEAETVALVVDVTKRNYPLVARYYDLKRQILGLDTLAHYDRYAPLFEAREKTDYAKAREIILEAFGAFSPTLAGIADEFFQNAWIDAEPRKGKRGGAFCSYTTPDLHPFVFTSYMEGLDDVMTLGHELGHGVHAYLSRPLGYLNMHGTLPIAELASTFGEMLVFEKLQETASPEDKLALYANKIEGIFATIFRQAAMYGFEREIHEKRRTEGELTTDAISEIWQRTQQEMLGSGVTLGEEHSCWWMYISHFIHVPFYVYAYTFGELLVLSLYAKAKAEGPSFESKYLDLLKAGGSLTPHDLMARVGIDIRDEAFWQGGFNVLEEMIVRFEELRAQTA